MSDGSAMVTVFGSGSRRLPPELYETAFRLGRGLAQHGLAVCNGGYGGTMEAAARGAKQAGGRAVGITLREASSRPNRWIDHAEEQPDLSSRILRLLELGDAWAVLPGGTGTLAEVGLLLELRNKGGLAPRPIVFVGTFWNPLLELMAGERLLRERAPYRATAGIRMCGAVAAADSAESAVAYLASNVAGGQPA